VGVGVASHRIFQADEGPLISKKPEASASSPLFSASNNNTCLLVSPHGGRR